MKNKLSEELLDSKKSKLNVGDSIFGGGRFVGLDIMRISLAFLIYLFHSNMHIRCNYYIFNNFISLGAIAMTGFFMLSGYCLYVSSQQKNLSDLREIKKFYIRRAISILPLYYFTALAFMIYELLTGSFNFIENAVLFPYEALCLQTSISLICRYIHNSGTWFVSCIMISYLFYPFLQEVLKQMSNKAKIYMTIVLCFILLYAPIIENVFDIQLIFIYVNPLFRLIEFTIGIIIAQVNYSPIQNRAIEALRSRNALFLSVVVLLLVTTIGLHIGLPVDYMLFNWVAVPCFVVMMIFLGYRKTNVNNRKWIYYLSSISYAFFLCQIGPIWKSTDFICGLLGSNNNLLKISVSFTYCLMGAVLIHEMIEKPSTNYLRRKLL